MFGRYGRYISYGRYKDDNFKTGYTSGKVGRITS